MGIKGKGQHGTWFLLFIHPISHRIALSCNPASTFNFLAAYALQKTNEHSSHCPALFYNSCHCCRYSYKYFNKYLLISMTFNILNPMRCLKNFIFAWLSTNFQLQFSLSDIFKFPMLSSNYFSNSLYVQQSLQSNLTSNWVYPIRCPILLPTNLLI